LQQADEQLYVVLLRHAIAPGTGDPASFRLDDCATQRNLSAAGRSQAQQTGAAFRQRDISVVQVLSSQWCRCLETAELMALGPVEPYPPLNSFFRDRSTATQQTNQVQAYVRNQPNRGVLVMVTHQVNITALTGIVPGSGQAVVVALNEEGELAQVGLLDAGQ
jgi:phosphohistidine phosphatase SixA